MLIHRICIIYTFFCVSILFAQINNPDENCECVPYYLCNNDSTINTNGETIIDIRFGGDTCKYLEICCGKKDVLNEPKVRGITVQTSGCGYRHTDGVGYRITGNSNNEAEFGEFPWMVAILEKNKKKETLKYKCGGSLIHPKVVLTAAHCVVGSAGLVVRAGEWDTKTTQELFTHQQIKVKSAIVHSQFKRSNLQNDVALLFLDTPFNTTEHIREICLPVQDSVTISSNCIVTGWGKDKFEKEGEYQNILKKIELSTISYPECQDAFRKTRLGQRFHLHQTFTCAGGEAGKDACTGDGGGPLVCPIEGKENRYQQVGIVAWGIGCGTQGVPGAYVDVAHFRNWIDNQMAKSNIDDKTYRF